MASVKASVWKEPTPEAQPILLTAVPDGIELPDVKSLIYILMLITILLFIKKLISTVCRRTGHAASAKDE